MQLDIFGSVILAGIVATYGLLIMALWAYRIGLPRLDFSRAMADLTYSESFDGNAPYWAGHVVIYFNGVIFALIYAAAVGEYLPGIPVMKGVIWGVILWFVSGIFFVPVYLREGFFLSGVHKNAWLSSLMVHVVYGLIIGWLSPIVGS